MKIVFHSGIFDTEEIIQPEWVKGDKGDQGEQGIQGFQGPKGDPADVQVFETFSEAESYSIANPDAIVFSRQPSGA